MSKIRIKTSYNENSNTYYHRDFYVSENDYKVGDFYNHEEIRKIEEIAPDIEARNADGYKLIKLITTLNGEFDLDNDEYCEEYIAVKL